MDNDFKSKIEVCKPSKVDDCSMELQIIPNQENSKLARELKSKYNANKLEFNCIPKQPEKPWYPENLVQLASSLTKINKPTSKQPEFKFTLLDKAALEYWKILEKYNLDLELALNQQKGTQLEYGSEFKKAEELNSILKNHPLCKRLSKQLLQGASYPLEEANEEELKKTSKKQ